MLSDTALRACGVFAVLLLWEIAGRALGAELLAPPSDIAPMLVGLFGQASIISTLGASFGAMLTGYVLACLIAIPLGVAMGRSSWFDALLHPWLSMFIVTSVAAVVPLLILMLGTGFWFRAAVVLLAAVWFIMLTVYQGARGIDRRWIDVGRSFGASHAQAFRTVLLPAMLPYVLIGLRIGLTHAIRAMVVAELFVLVGIGRMLHDSGFDLSTARLLSLLTVIAAAGLLANALLDAAARRLAPWSTALESQAARPWGRTSSRLRKKGRMISEGEPHAAPSP